MRPFVGTSYPLSLSGYLCLRLTFPQLPPWEVLFKGWGATEKNSSPCLPQKALTDEFRELRATVERMGLMKANHLFFLFYLLHILLLDVAAWLTLWIFGTSLVPFTLCAVLLSTVQVSALACCLFLEVLVKTPSQEALLGSVDTPDSARGENTHPIVWLSPALYPRAYFGSVIASSASLPFPPLKFQVQVLLQAKYAKNQRLAPFPPLVLPSMLPANHGPAPGFGLTVCLLNVSLS